MNLQLKKILLLLTRNNAYNANANNNVNINGDANNKTAFDSVK